MAWITTVDLLAVELMVSVPLEETVPYSDPLITVQVADSVTSVTLSQIAVN